MKFAVCGCRLSVGGRLSCNCQEHEADRLTSHDDMSLSLDLESIAFE